MLFAEERKTTYFQYLPQKLNDNECTQFNMHSIRVPYTVKFY